MGRAARVAGRSPSTLLRALSWCFSAPTGGRLLLRRPQMGNPRAGPLGLIRHGSFELVVMGRSLQHDQPPHRYLPHTFRLSSISNGPLILTTQLLPSLTPSTPSANTMPMITPALRQASASSSSSSIAATSSSSATLSAQALPPLAQIPLDSTTLSRITPPVKRIASEEDVEKWKASQSYADYLLFVQRVCEASVGKPTQLPAPPSSSDASPRAKLVKLLYTLDSWTSEIEPQARPQRFGNLAFRDWGVRLSERLKELHRQLLPEHLHPFITELKAYLLDSFGSFTRIDYGSGHEFAFFAWVCMLYRLGFFGEEDEVEKVEERIGVEIFPLYLMVVWKLQDRYGLEPAGSHGVWGLDDFQFLPYVLGAAQLRTQSALQPGSIIAASTNTDQLPDRTPSTLIAHALHLPQTLLVRTDPVVAPNLYLSSLLRIQVLKRGPFHEHSPLLHDIATTVPNWVKVYGGMLKMYSAECLGKKVVVQHFPFGGVGFVWDDSATPTMGVTAAAARQAGAGMALGGVKGNLGGMGVPTARMGGAGIRSVGSGGAARLGHALGLGPRPTAQMARPARTMLPTASASSRASAMVPPLRKPVPTTSKPSQGPKEDPAA